MAFEGGGGYGYGGGDGFGGSTGGGGGGGDFSGGNSFNDGSGYNAGGGMATGGTDSYMGGMAGGGGGGYAAGAGGGAGTGGGYMASQGSPGASKDYAKLNVVPVTVRQLLKGDTDQPDNSLHVDGQAVNMVKLIGRVVQVEDAAAYTSLLVDDNTGAVLVKDWETERIRVRPGAYVRVIGAYKHDQHVILSKSLVHVTDFDEVTAHCLEAIFVHLSNTKGVLAPPPPTNTAGGAAGAAGGARAAAPVQNQWGGGQSTNFAASSSAASSSFAAQSNSFNAGSASFGGGAGFEAGSGSYTPLQAQILDIIRADNAGELGTAVDKIMMNLGNVTEEQLTQQLETLTNEGHVYSTIDDKHWQLVG